MRKVVIEYAKEMDKILDEKFEEFQDSWKKVDLYVLKNSLNEQFEKLIISDNNVKEAMKTLLHLGNYGAFLYARLKELNK